MLLSHMLLREKLSQLRGLAERKWLQAKVGRCAKSEGPVKVILGSGGVNQPGWIPTDQRNLDLLNLSDFRYIFAEAKVSAFLAEHVWEHLSTDQAVTALRNCFEFLNFNSHIRIAVPDGNFPDENYLSLVRPGGTGSGADDHKVLYDVDSLSALLKQCGLNPCPVEYWDKSGTFQSINYCDSLGKIHRSKTHDPRNQGNVLRYTSLIVDGFRN